MVHPSSAEELPDSMLIGNRVLGTNPFKSSMVSYIAHNKGAQLQHSGSTTR